MNYSGTIRNQVYNTCASESLYYAVQIQTAQAWGEENARKISIYQNQGDARALVGKFYEDAGTGSLGNLVNLMTGKSIGLAEESLWSNASWRMYMKPPQEVYDNAAKFKIVSYRSLGESFGQEAWKKVIGTELSHGKPVMVVLDSLEGSGRHVVTFVEELPKEWRLLNSWGTDYADNGYGKLAFTDSLKIKGAYVVDEYTGLDFKWTPNRETVAKLYSVILDRCVERDGLIFWSKLADGGMSITSIAEAMYSSPEAQALHGKQTNAQFAAELYHDAIGRNARDVDVTFFDSVLKTGMNRGVLSAHFVDLVSKGLDTQDADIRLDNIANVSVNYALTYQNNVVGEYAQNILDTITHDQGTVLAAIVGMQHEQGWQ